MGRTPTRCHLAHATSRSHYPDQRPASLKLRASINSRTAAGTCMTGLGTPVYTARSTRRPMGDHVKLAARVPLRPCTLLQVLLSPRVGVSACRERVLSKAATGPAWSARRRGG